MANQKSVEFALKLTGIDPKALTPLIDAFKTLDTSVKTAQTTLNSLKNTLDGIKSPKGLTSFVDSLEKFSKIKLKDLTPLATNLSKISAIGKFPAMGAFANAVTQLSSTSFSGLGNLATGLASIAKIDVAGTVTKLQSLNSAIAALGKAGGLSAFTSFASNVKGLSVSLNGAQASMNQTIDSANQFNNAMGGAGRSTRGFADKIRTVFDFRLISEGFQLLKSGIVGGISAIFEYDQALKDLQAITGSTETEVGQMGAKILEVASTTKFSASEVAAGMRTLGQAGFSASESIQTMQGVSDLATGTLSDMALTVDLVTTAMRVFDVEASRSQEIVDVFANAVNGSKLTVDKLRTSMNYVGPIARDANVSFQELSAAMMTLANSGIRASTIGTSLRQVFSNLVSPTKAFRAAAADAGISMQDLNPATAGLSSVLDNLKIVVKDTGTAFDIFGKRGASAAIALTSNNSQYQELLSNVSKTGTAAEMASIQVQGLSLSFKNLKDKLGVLAITLGKSGIATVFKSIIATGQGLVNVFIAIANNPVGRFFAGLTTILVSLAAVVGVAGLAMAGFNKALAFTVANSAAAATGISGVGVAINFLKVNLGPISIILTGLGILFSIFGKNAQEAADKIAIAESAFKSLKEKLDTYATTTATMKEGSEDLSAANINLRKDLLETASKYGEVSTEAIEAANSIDGVSGKILDGGYAIEYYAKALQKVRLEKLIEGGDSINKILENQGNWWYKTNNLINDYWQNVKKGKLGEFFKEGAAEADWFASAISEGAVSVQQIADYVKKLDQIPLGNLTNQQIVISKNYKKLQEEAAKGLDFLKSTGQVSMSTTIEGMQDLAEKSGFTGRRLEEMVYQFKKMKDAAGAGFDNVIEKWAKEGANSIVEVTNAYIELGGATSKAEQAQIKQNATARAALTNQLAILEEGAQAEINAGADAEKVWAKFYTDKEALERKAGIVQRELRDNQTVQNALALARERDELEKHLAEIAVRYKDSTGAVLKDKAREEAKARADFAAKELNLLQGVGVGQKVEAAQYKTHIQELSTIHAAYIADLAKQEAQGFITKEKFDVLKLGSTVDLNKKLLEEAQKLEQKMKETGSAEDYEKSKKERLKVQEDLSKSQVALDLYVTKERTKADENYVKNKLKIETDLAKKLKDIDEDVAKNKKKWDAEILSDQLDLSEKINAKWRKSNDISSGGDRDRIKAYDQLKKANDLLNKAITEGDEEKVNSALKLIKMSEKLADGLDNESQSAALLRKVLESTSKARDTKYELKELELIKKKNEEIAEAALKQENEKKIYDAKIKEASRAYDFINKLEYTRHQEEMAYIKIANDQRIKNEQLRKDYAESGLKFYLTEEEYIKQRGVEQVKQNDVQISFYDKFISLEEQKAKIAKDAADYVAGGGSMSEEEYIKSATEALKKKSEEIVKSSKEQDTANKKVKDSIEYIIEYKDGYYQVTEQVKSATEELDKFQKITQNLEGGSFDYKFTTTASPTVPFTEGINNIKQKLLDLVKENYDKVINITLSGMSIVMSNLDSLVKKLDKIKDKTVTITTKYKSTGDKPSGYATGGRLPGYGGGDRIPILGESGEWVINKLAVRKYGDNFLSQLNNMTLPKFQNGGSISPSSSAVKQNIVNNTNSFEGFADFGKVLIDTGKIKLPVIAHKDVVSELTSYMKRSSLMGANS